MNNDTLIYFDTRIVLTHVNGDTPYHPVVKSIAQEGKCDICRRKFCFTVFLSLIILTIIILQY